MSSIQRARIRRIAAAVPGARTIYHGVREQAFQRLLKRLSPGIYHEPNYIPAADYAPLVLTVHDLSHYHFPQHHPQQRVAWLERHLLSAMERAAAIITVSRFVASELNAYFGVGWNRLHPIPNGVSSRFHPREAAVVAPELAAFGLQPGAYILAVATLEPRKNLETLLQAHEQLPPALRQRYPLVLAGAPGWNGTALARRIDRRRSRGTVHYLGYVDEARLPLLYAGATGFAYPAVYEGFGLPPLEALASGVPTLVGNAGALPEVVGDVALRVNPHDVDAVRMGLLRLLTDTQWRTSVHHAGPERAAQFSWEATAAATLRVYQQVACSA